MYIQTRALLITAILAWPSLALAVDSEPLARVEAGFAAYEKGGAQAAITEWVKGSPMEGSKEALSQANLMAQIEVFYGPFQGHSVVQTKQLSASTQILYATFDYQQGPAFAYFLLYRQPGKGWIIPQFKFHTDFVQVWPASVYSD